MYTLHGIALHRAAAAGYMGGERDLVKEREQRMCWTHAYGASPFFQLPTAPRLACFLFNLPGSLKAKETE